MAPKPGHENGEVSITADKDSKIQRVSAKSRVAILIKDNALILATLLGIVLGFCLGLALREANPSDDALMWLGLPGELFLRCLKCTIVPLIFSMVITCTSNLDPKSNGKIAVVATLGFLFTQLLAVLTAILMFFIFKPDSSGGKSQGNEYTDLQTQDVFADLIRNFFPDNVVGATISQTTTVYTREEVSKNSSAFNSTVLYTKLKRSTDTVGGINILGLITVSTAVGIAANKILSAESEFLRFFKQTQNVVLLIITWLFWVTPVGVASLIAKSVASVDDIRAVFEALGLLCGAVLVGLVVYQFIIIPALLFIFLRKNPYIFLVRCLRPSLIAFASTATSVALPDMLTSSDRNNIEPAVSAFVIPMSVTLHADGSALYIASSALFLAQTSGMGLQVGNYFVIATLSSVLSLAIPPVPSSSIVTLVIILTSLSYPLEDIALLFAVEWLLDRCRSAVNAVGHIVVAALTDRLCTTKKLNRHTEEEITAPPQSDLETGPDNDIVGTFDKTENLNDDISISYEKVRKDLENENHDDGICDETYDVEYNDKVENHVKRGEDDVDDLGREETKL